MVEVTILAVFFDQWCLEVGATLAKIARNRLIALPSNTLGRYFGTKPNRTSILKRQYPQLPNSIVITPRPRGMMESSNAFQPSNTN
ncbi:hypothetical protein [Methylacidiphilum sp. Yel]|uniref:hypothetical protein n=1 Tax=Methylacidiphilum sp. Yel TaxID=1847730 RepID=UPI00106D589D